MTFQMIHNNFNVLDLEKSLAFYKKALGLTETRRIAPEDGSFIIVYLSDNIGSHLLELTWVCDRKEPYDLGDNEFHLCFHTGNYEEAHKLHEEMGCICYENSAMGLYFIEDPDGYWLEVIG